jgi:hypothetical protein
VDGAEALNMSKAFGFAERRMIKPQRHRGTGLPIQSRSRPAPSLGILTVGVLGLLLEILLIRWIGTARGQVQRAVRRAGTFKSRIDTS